MTNSISRSSFDESLSVVVIGDDDVYICLRVVRRNVVDVNFAVVLAIVVVVVVDVVVTSLISRGFETVTMTPQPSLFISYNVAR